MQEPSCVRSSKIAGLISVAAAAIIVPSSSERLISPAPSLMVHGPIQPHRNDDGSLARGLRDQIDTSNWSGYAVAKFETGFTYTGASATWTVPTVTYGQDASGSTEEYSSTWVGIGGFCENTLCTHVDRTLIQLGTEQDISSPTGGVSTTNYYAWYEMLPQASIKLDPSRYPVQPNDIITASLSCSTNTCSSKTQSWTLTMTNTSKSWTWSQTFSYASSKLSAVWIEEAPYLGGVLPLADFGTASFDALTVNNPNDPNSVTPTLVQAEGIQMTDPWGQTATPSSPIGTGFDVCWGANTCP